LASLGFYKARESAIRSGAGLDGGATMGFPQGSNGVPADETEDKQAAERGDEMKASIPLPIKEDSADAVDEQSGQGEEENAYRPVAIERFDTLGAVDVDRKDRRQDGDGEGGNEGQIEDQQTAHDALSVH